MAHPLGMSTVVAALVVLLACCSTPIHAGKIVYSTGPCKETRFTPSVIPKPWSNGADILATKGWAPGRFEDYMSPAHGRTFQARLWNLDAFQCYQAALCRRYLMNFNVRFISWQAIWCKGTRGQCFLFGEETCSPKYNPNVQPYIFNASNWYSTDILKPADDEFTKATIDKMDCDMFLTRWA